MTEYYGNNDWRDYNLAHHGILGQKWGVRRFQNYDGSLTSAGRSRYGFYGDPIDAKSLFSKQRNFLTLAAELNGNTAEANRLKSPVATADDYKDFYFDKARGDIYGSEKSYHEGKALVLKMLSLL